MSSRINDLAHLKIPLESILSATNNFDEKNVVGGSGIVKIYKGELLWSGELIIIGAGRFNKDRDEKFWTEVSMLSSLKHQNLVSLVGFCDENGEKIIITSGKMKGSLSNYLNDATLLSWVQRLKISVGLAQALSYIHYDEPRDFSVIHRDISSFTVLLNDSFEPKLSCFDTSMKIEASQRHHSFHTSKVWSTNGYTDPAYKKTKSVNHKTDVYSFGIVLFELLCGRKAVIATNKYLAPAAILHYKEKKLDDIIDWDLRKQMNPQSFNIFAETAYQCLNEEQFQRPSIDEIVTRLEKVLELQLEHQNAIMSSRINDLAHLKIPLESMLSATNNFDEKNVVARGGIVKKYKGELLWSGELIIIDARRFNKDRDEMFWTEVSMLSSLKHQNLVSLLGFCDENGEKIIITRGMMKGSLSNYLNDATLLSWVQRLKISVGLAQALSYTHYDEPRDFSVIHRDISSFTVLLNDSFEPKLSCFHTSMKTEASQRHHSFHTSKVWSTNGYTDPAYEKTKSVNHKTDVYSFGIVLFELLCGRKAVIANDTNKYLAPAAILHYKEKKLDKMIDCYLWKQMDPQSFNVFAETAYECLNEEQSQRPSIVEIVTRLEKVLELAHENRPHSMKIKASERNHSFHIDPVWCTKGYTDPTCLETKSVNHTSDIYSFGILLFELLCGRKSVIDDHDNKYLAPAAIFHYRKKIVNEMIDPDLWKQMDPQSFNVFTETAYGCLNEEQLQRPNIGEIVARLEKALELQMAGENRLGSVTSVFTGVESHVSKKTMSSPKDLSRSKLSFEDIQSATNRFAQENVIKELGFGKILKGRLLQSKQFNDIIVKAFFSTFVNDKRKEFWTEISMLSSLKHKNLVSLIGFHDDTPNKFIIYKKEANESLDKYLNDQTLTWMQRLKICLGVANALSYIHYDAGRDFSVIHCNITSSNILLDDKVEPKLSGFERSLKNTVARRHRLLLTRDIIENVYMDPKYKKTGGVTHKSDVYSLGVVLFEVLCGRSAVDEDELGEGLLSKLTKSCLDDLINPRLLKQMDPEAFRIFSETVFYCLHEERAKRPHIDQVVNRLEKALQLQWKHENQVDSTSFNRLKEKNLEHLKIGLDVINEATKNFDDAYCIGSGGFGKVYKADLEHFDCSNSSSIDGVNKCDLPRKRSTVAIKRIHNQEGEQGFISEIETLTTCKHDNIINLLGFCYEGNGSMILVYEHASKGSLENYLGNSDAMTNLTWVQRLKICLGIAHGLNYIHNNTDHGKQKMIHRDIKSDNILLGNNWEAKIADFGLSKFHPADQAASTIYTNMIAGTYVYLDPEYEKYGKLNKKSDIYSFGVVLFEILTGRLAYDFDKGIAPIARHHFEKGRLMEIVDHKIKEETDEHIFSLSKGPNKESLDIFSNIAFRCIAETQVKRPSIDVVINELKKALKLQENHKDSLKLSLEDIKLATQDFSQDNIIGHGGFGNVYKGVTHSDGHNIAAKRLDRKSAEGEAEFMTELEILMEYKHVNVIGLVGYCDEENEKLIVYEYASMGSLDKYLSNDSLMWVMRLRICIDIAIGLEFLHGNVTSPEMVIHRDINSSNILLFDDWKAKITDFGLSLVCPTSQDVDYLIDNVTGTIGYRDPLYSKTGFLTKESDIFSLGAVLFDILCGKLSSEKLDDEYSYLPFLAKQHCHEGKLDDLVFEGIKEQIVPQSFVTFTMIALQCLHHKRERRPTAKEVVIQLKKALEFQEDYDIWESKLPKDYKEIIQMSKCPEDYSIIKKEDLYNIFSKGILLQQDKVHLASRFYKAT
ncbi:Protein kinase, ATP binding site-containing protein [Artemisia annua]|uniref:non-specific serine/threonine protein kinase n=1 Tax=Artemisia annua TaxID=35608 RepID=A0A2U1QF68_ARTAN|nr:Protein kinase, ATP binding site-containing protein [Artemisia annua]